MPLWGIAATFEDTAASIAGQPLTARVFFSSLQLSSLQLIWFTAVTTSSSAEQATPRLSALCFHSRMERGYGPVVIEAEA